MMTNKNIEALKEMKKDIYKLRRHEVHSPFLSPLGIAKETIALNSVIEIIDKCMDKIGETENEDITISQAIQRVSQEYPLKAEQIQNLLENINGITETNFYSSELYAHTDFSIKELVKGIKESNLMIVGNAPEKGIKPINGEYTYKVLDELDVRGEELTAVITKYRDLNYGVIADPYYKGDFYDRPEDWYKVKIVKVNKDSEKKGVSKDG